MDPIIANEKYDLAIRTFEKLAEFLAKNIKDLPDEVPIMLIGGASLESYGIRDSGVDIDIFIPSECCKGVDIDEVANDLMKDDPVFRRMEDCLVSDPDYDPLQKVIEIVKDRDLYTEMDNGKFEDLVDPLNEIQIGTTKFQFKMPDLATIAFSKSNSFREKDLRDVALIVERIGMKRYMDEGNRLKEFHGDERIGVFITDALNNIAMHLAMNSDYLDFIKESLSYLDLDPSVMTGLYESYGVSGEVDPEIWPEDDWEPEYDKGFETDISVK